MKPHSRRLLLLMIFVPLLWVFGAAASQAAEAPVAHTIPVSNEVLSAAPSQITVIPDGAATTGSATVLNSSGKQVAGGTLKPAGGGMLVLPMPGLSNGVYLVKWTAGSESAAFAFDVAGSGISPATVVQPKPSTPLGPIEDDVVEWLPLLAIMTFVGVLFLRFFVSAPAARRAGAGEALQSSDRRLTRIAAVSIVVFVPTTLAQMSYDEGSFDFGGIWSSLGADGDGHVNAARLILTAVAALCVVPLAFRRLRQAVPLLAVGLGSGLLELALREVPTEKPKNVPRTIFGDVLYIGHLWGAAIWIGGLVGLVGLVVARAIPADARRAFWPPAVRRFSAAAMGSVAALVLSGLWLYWVHVDGVGQLASTMYGRTLLVKLIAVAVLVLIGAVNQFWLMPKLDSYQARGNDGALNHAITRDFRVTIAVEALLAIAVLFIAPLLGGSARNQAFQASDHALAQTSTVDGTKVELIPSAQQPGLIDYRVKISGVAARAVTLNFASPKLGIPAQQVTANAMGDDTFRAIGYYAPVVGDWQVTVSADNAAPAVFELPITADPAELTRSLPPKVRWTTWVFGIGETLLVALAMFSSFRISRRLTANGLGTPGTAGTPDAPDGGGAGVRRELVDA
jgi:putative copper export protein/methionine-rich copper-binding protein CopC